MEAVERNSSQFNEPFCVPHTALVQSSTFKAAEATASESIRSFFDEDSPSEEHQSGLSLDGPVASLSGVRCSRGGGRRIEAGSDVLSADVEDNTRRVI